MSKKDSRRQEYAQSVISKVRELMAMSPFDLEATGKTAVRPWGTYYIGTRTKDTERWRSARRSWKTHHYRDGEVCRPVFEWSRKVHHTVRILADDDPRLPVIWKAWRRQYVRALLEQALTTPELKVFAHQLARAT